LLAQPGDDYEIVVADNCGDEQVGTIIKSAQARHPRVKHTRCDRILPMAANWERGLAACSGEYVTVLGDDDGFLPTTLDVIRRLVALSNAKVIAWDVHAYWWPDTIAYWNRNKLYVVLGNNELTWQESRPVLVETYRNVVSFGGLPSIYTGIVHRDVINSVIAKFGGYFVPADMPPDVCSGIINLTRTGRFLYSSRPLAVRGNSRRSTGTSYWARSFGKEQQQIYLREEGKTLEQLYHSSMFPSENIGFCVAMNKLHLKDLLFPNDQELTIDLTALVRHTIADLNHEPEAYEANLADALRLAERIGMTVDRATIPSKAAVERKAIQGPFSHPKSNINIAVNCDLLDIFDVAGAARLAAAMSSEPLIEAEVATPVSTPALRKAG
jgi:hypothetical protein